MKYSLTFFLKISINALKILFSLKHEIKSQGPSPLKGRPSGFNKLFMFVCFCGGGGGEKGGGGEATAFDATSQVSFSATVAA